MLEHTNELPLMQSGFWHYHGYWFEYLGEKVGKDWENAIRAVWGVARPSNGTDYSREDSLRHMRNAVFSPYFRRIWRRAQARRRLSLASKSNLSREGKGGVNDATTIIPLDARHDRHGNAQEFITHFWGQ